MREFWIYTLMRSLVFAATWLVVALVWALVSSGEVHTIYVTIIAFALSGLISYGLLNRQREALAQRVQGGASSVSQRYERMRSAEDDDAAS